MTGSFFIRKYNMMVLLKKLYFGMWDDDTLGIIKDKMNNAANSFKLKKR